MEKVLKYSCLPLRSPPTCCMSDPAHPHILCRPYDPPLSVCFACKGQNLNGSRGLYFYCATCNVEFHKDCHKFQPEIIHPFHPSHQLTFISSPNHESDDSETSKAAGATHFYVSGGSFLKCKCCLRLLGKLYYHCSTCKFNLDASCTINSPPSTILHKKSHEHTLTLFPRRLSLPCDACGLSLEDTADHVYTSALPSGGFPCGVCRQTVDVNYGQYSCIKGCPHAFHSKCATRDDVWDGKDLEGVPEDPDEDTEPFTKIDEYTIHHFSHEHFLKIQGMCNPSDRENKFCQACILPITASDNYYSCMECDFTLHEVCACLPRKKHHPIHKHPLTLLHPFPPKRYDLWFGEFAKGMVKCSGCHRESCGFIYRCSEKNCEFQLDTRCASLPDPLVHGSHPHDLFFNLTKGRCMGCKSYNCSPYSLECIQCKSFLGLRCATLPSVAYYKHDKHLLRLCYGEEEEEEEEEKTTKLKYWCEVCETKLDPTEWFYTCDEYCNVTVHVTCLLGIDMYMKPNHIIKIYDNEVEIVRNDGNFRPFCDQCSLRCLNTLVFRSLKGNFCNLEDMMDLWSLESLQERMDKLKKMSEAAVSNDE
ncbi:uncharacterized protein LOC18011369 [Eutrema salsugineum]|uniref:uncharacterized protein LOC18011369 n=1 Tax=Eutrema salsugineum TaxID=72664 RepID=UPI000CED6E01|nr:uncharacterized protein LOC18011369 [Eutrema salsugineum]